MNATAAVLIKLAALFLFAAMSALVRFVGESIPVAQTVFFRGAFAIVPLVAFYAARKELTTAMRTSRPLGHLLRGLIGVAGMFLNFAALARLPLVDATAITFAAPLITVALAALVLKEKVRLFRWSAVVVGLFGVVLMLWPYLNLGKLLAAGAADSTIGALCALGAAFTNAAAIIQTRRLTHSETTASIVFYFSLSPTIVTLFALPFVWRTPTAVQLAALIAIGALGGIAHILLTESYRYASASLLAPFDYVALLFAFLCGYVLFGELPAPDIYIGGAIVVGSGLVVFFRERRLAKARRQAGLLEPRSPEDRPPASDEAKRP